MASKTISAVEIWLWLKAPGDAWKPCAKWREYKTIEDAMGGPDPMPVSSFLYLPCFSDNEKLWALLRWEYLSPPILSEFANELMARTDRLMLAAWPNSKKKQERAQSVREAIDDAVDTRGQVRAYAITFIVGRHVDENEYPFYMQRLREILSGD